LADGPGDRCDLPGPSALTAPTPASRRIPLDIDSLKQLLGTTALDLALKVLAALAFWFIGRWLIGRVVALMRAAMGRNHIDPTLVNYLGSIVAVALNIELVLGILGYFGVQTTSFAAMLAGRPAPTPSRIIRQA
jgi:small-conductance mechanosensitive channel